MKRKKYEIVKGSALTRKLKLFPFHAKVLEINEQMIINYKLTRIKQKRKINRKIYNNFEIYVKICKISEMCNKCN